MPELAGRKALVTEARQGLGAAIARELASRGALVAACGRKQRDCLPVVRAIEKADGRAFDHGLDVAALETVNERVLAAANALNGLDILVNNAAVIEPMGRILATDFHEACQVNLSGAFAVLNAAWPALSGSDRVLNVLSGAAVYPVIGSTAYCASKAGLYMLTKSVELEGKPIGIRGFGSAPGLVDTAMQEVIRMAKINTLSDFPRERLLDPAVPARVAVWLVSGTADDLAGTMVDIRDPEIGTRTGWESE